MQVRLPGRPAALLVASALVAGALVAAQQPPAANAAPPVLLDQGFGNLGILADAWWDDGITAVAAGPGGTIVGAGTVLDTAGTKVFGVARYDSAGNLDPTFGGDGRATAGAGDLGGIAYAVAVAEDGTTLVAGQTAEACPTPYFTPRSCGAFARFLPDGTLDPSFGGDGIVIPPADHLWATAVYDVALLPGGRILAVGVDSNPDVDETAVFRLTPDGSLEDLDGDRVGDVAHPDYCHYSDSRGECTSTPASWSHAGTSVAVLPDGKILVAGAARVDVPTQGFVGEIALARFGPDLAPDLSFGYRGTRITAAPEKASCDSTRVALRPDGSSVTAAFCGIPVPGRGGDGRIVLARHTTDGDLAPDGLQASPFGTEYGALGDLATDTEGRLLVAGTLRGGWPDYSTDFALRRFLPDGSVDGTFGGGTVTGASLGFHGTDATDLLVQPDGAILAVGRGYDWAPAGHVTGVLIRIAAPGYTAPDGDGVPDAEENAGPNGGDGNADGVADSAQDNVATLRSAGAGSPYLTLASPPGTGLVGVAAGPTPPDAPPGDFPLGALSFTVVGVGPDPVPLDVFYPGVSVNSWFKYQAGAWIPFAAHFTSLGPDHGRLTLQDGGPGDQGPAGDGDITDPSVPALVDIDTSPPVTTPTATGTAGDGGWYRSPVVVDLHATDDTAVAWVTYTATGAMVQGATTVLGDTAQVTVPAEGTTTVEFAATDTAGNTEEARTLEVRVDTTAPDVACATPGAGWSATDVTVACTASDPTSGLADPGDATFALGTTVPAGVETADARTGTRAVADLAGNTTTAGPIGGIRVDKKAPVVTLTTPAEGDSYAQGAVVVPVFDCSDGASGVAACSGPATVATHAPGPQSFAVTATDNVGNTTTVTHAYTVTDVAAADRVDVTFTGGIAFEAKGPVTSGDFRVSRDAGGVVAVSGTGTTGSTVVSVSVRRFLWTTVHTGWVRVTDSSAGLAVTTPLVLVPVRAAGATGATATSSWMTSGRPARGYRLTWRIDDLA